MYLCVCVRVYWCGECASDTDRLALRESLLNLEIMTDALLFAKYLQRNLSTTVDGEGVDDIFACCVFTLAAVCCHFHSNLGASLAHLFTIVSSFSHSQTEAVRHSFVLPVREPLGQMLLTAHKSYNFMKRERSCVSLYS